MFEGYQLLIAHQMLKLLYFPDGFITRDIVKNLRRKHEKTAIDKPAFRQWLFDKLPDLPIQNIQRAKRASGRTAVTVASLP